MSDLAVGLMSGTSLDGVSAALVRIRDAGAVELLRFRTNPYSSAERAELRGAMQGGTARDLALLHVKLGELLARAAVELLVDAGVKPADLAFVASHGHTVWHEPGRATLQLGD